MAGEKSADTLAEVLGQTAAASESADGPQEEAAGQLDSEEDNSGEEEQQGGCRFGHAKLPPDVYTSNPFHKTRGGKQHVVWNDVKGLKKHTAHGTTVDDKYTHVCLARITAAKAGEEGEDEDDDGNWRWYCNKLLKIKMGKTCYNTSQATAHIKMHGDNTEAGKALGKRAAKDNSHKGDVMEAASRKQEQRSGAAHTRNFLVCARKFICSRAFLFMFVFI
jgi:hypothetical protein